METCISKVTYALYLCTGLNLIEECTLNLNCKNMLLLKKLRRTCLQSDIALFAVVNIG